MQLHWHRRDLRAADNRGLAFAADAGPVVPLFVFDDGVLEHAGAPRVRYLLDALGALRERYRALGSDLVVRRGDPRDVVPRVALDVGAERVVWNKDYSGLARERDTAVRRALDGVDVPRESVHDHLHHEPGSITTNAGEPYSVYTYFWKKWRDREKAEPYPEPPGDSLADPAVVDDTGALPSIADLGFEEPDATVQEAGADPARERLDRFCDDGVFRYETDRDYPTREAVSRLSADLKWGTLGVREVYAATEAAMDAAEGDEEETSVEEFQSQLAWREFYTHVLFFNPEVVTANYKEYENDIEWRDDPEELAAWREGRTGYPIVDAGMRQLKAEAYMHNRVRMIVASFLTKDLLCDWRHGYAHFRNLLADHDTQNDNGGWQWAASTGTDAQPYFRIFNPMTQGERYDPDAEYITRYVPELEGVDPSVVHSWHECSALQRRNTAPDYPEPIVDHSERREEALAMFERARGDD
ncbi:deoxyribodipyrimidine photo-lyase [Salinigranum sp.]|uniref:cryptochrome/photolyase family protein n=1 Tax=Salinigranum sp. TaxID=1966351 RepID=UPI003567209B